MSKFKIFISIIFFSFEVQLDYYYLTSPSMIEKKIEHLGIKKYIHMEYSNIFLSIENFINIQSKHVTHKTLDEKKVQKK